MKKIMKPFVLVAAAAMALASCQKNEIPAPEKQDVHFTINAGIETKTSIVESEDKDENGKPIYHAQWDGDEELGVLFAAPNDKTTANDVVKLTNAESGSLASFQGTVTVDDPAGTFYAFYPAAAFNRGYGEGDARLDLKNVQKPTETSFDPSCDILVAKPYNYEVVEGKVVADGLEFARLMSVLRIDLKSEFVDIQNEFVESVSFTAGDVEITGYARVFLNNPKFDKWASNGAQWCTVTANYDSDLVSINGTSNSVYLVIAPVTIPANKELTFEIKTKNYNISKTIKSPEMKFTAGKVSKINLTIAEDNCEKIDLAVDYSGEYLIVDTKLTKAASKWADGNNLPAVDLNTIDGIVYESDNLADCKMTITKVTEGENAGKYTIKDAAGKYLYAASSSKNQLKGKDEESYWTIIEGDGKYIMTSHSQETRNILRYNGENTPPIFSCYSSGQSDVTLYKYSDIKADTNPNLEVDTTPIELAAAGGEGTINVTEKNLPASVQVRALVEEGAQDDVDWLTVDYEDGVITYSAGANESTEERTAYIEVYVSDDLKTGVSVTQAGKTAAGEPTEVTDVLTRETTGITATSYSEWSGKKATSSAVYAGQSAGSNVSIQLRSKESNSGIVTTASGGYAKKIKVTWNSNTTSGRTLDIYGKNTAYSKATELYNTSTQGTKLGSIKYGTSTELVITGDYKYIGLRSNDGAMYLSEIAITWSSEDGGETPEPEQPTLSPRNLEFSITAATATIGQTFTAPTLNGEISGVTYSSSNTGVATVNASTGAITLVAAGSTTITATAPETDQYEAGTASYTLTVNKASSETQTTTTSYTFTSNAWNDSTKSWTSGKNGNQYTSGQGVQVTTGVSGANATCKTSFSNVSKVVVRYCTNSSKGAGTIKVTIGSVSKTFTVSKTGGTTLRDATFDFSASSPSGTPKIEVTCTTNSVYVNSITITHTN